MSRMTLDEKIGQLRLISIGGDMPLTRLADEIAAGRVGGTFNSVTRKDNRPLQDAAIQRSRLNIPMLFAYDVIHGYRTIFPIPLGQAASLGPAAGDGRARRRRRGGGRGRHPWTFAPMVDIARDPRWGRIAEGFGEDPYLGVRSGAARRFAASRAAPLSRRQRHLGRQALRAVRRRRRRARLRHRRHEPDAHVPGLPATVQRGHRRWFGWGDGRP